MEARIQDLPKVAELMKRMLAIEPSERPTSKSLLVLWEEISTEYALYSNFTTADERLI